MHRDDTNPPDRVNVKHYLESCLPCYARGLSNGERMPKRYDIVVAGAGISGLSLAALLALEGSHSVLLLEKGSVPGGRFKVEKRDGYLLDWGIHACLLGARGAIGEVLRRCASPVRISPVGMALYHDGALRAILGERLISIARQQALSSLDMARLGLAVFREWGESSYATSVAQWVETHRASAAVELLLKALCIGLLATDQFDRASIGELFSFLRQTARHGSAVGYPQGGWGPVLDTLLETVQGSPKCESRFDFGLECVIAPRKRVRAVVVNGEEIECRAVVCAFPPQMLAERVTVDPPLPAEYGRCLASLEESAGLCIEMGLNRPVTPDTRVVFSVDPPALVWAVSNLSPRVAPPGKQLIQFFSPLGPDQQKDERFISDRLDSLVDLGAAVFGGPLDEDWRRHMVTTVGGVVPFTGQARPERPAVEVPGYSGLFLIGDGVCVAGLGGDLAVRSALVAESLVCEYVRQ